MDYFKKVYFFEFGKVNVNEEKFVVGDLIEEEVVYFYFVVSFDDDVGIGYVGIVEVVFYGFFIDVFWFNFFFKDVFNYFFDGVCYFVFIVVCEGYVEVVVGVFFCCFFCFFSGFFYVFGKYVFFVEDVYFDVVVMNFFILNEFFEFFFEEVYEGFNFFF